MKQKLYLIAVCTSIFCGNSVWGGDSCPMLEGWDGQSGIGSWALAYNKRPETPPKDFVFCNAWIYDLQANEPNNSAKCHYTTREMRANGCAGSSCEGACVVVSFNKPNAAINSSNHHFGAAPRDQEHPGYHCRSESIGDCVFLDGGYPNVPMAPIQ